MNPIPPHIAQDEERLAQLAMKFRGTRRDAEHQDIAKDYSQTVERLIHSGSWQVCPMRKDGGEMGANDFRNSPLQEPGRESPTGSPRPGG